MVSFPMVPKLLQCLHIVASVMHCLVTMGRVVAIETVFVVNLWGTKTKCACSILKPLITTRLGLVEVSFMIKKMSVLNCTVNSIASPFLLKKTSSCRGGWKLVICDTCEIPISAT